MSGVGAGGPGLTVPAALRPDGSSASSLRLRWGEEARPAECCSGTGTSGGRGLAVLAGGYKGRLPG